MPLDRKLLTKGRFRAHAHYAEREKALAATLETKRQNRTRAWKQSRTRAELALPASQRYGPAEPAGPVDPTAFDAAACDFRPLAPLPRFFAAAATKSTAAIANLSRPDVSLSWDRFVRGGATATKTLDDQTATFVDLKAVARAAPRRTLIFLATHGSACHLVHLQSCWPGALRRAPTLSRADVWRTRADHRRRVAAADRRRRVAAAVPDRRRRVTAADRRRRVAAAVPDRRRRVAAAAQSAPPPRSCYMWERARNGGRSQLPRRSSRPTSTRCFDCPTRTSVLRGTGGIKAVRPRGPSSRRAAADTRRETVPPRRRHEMRDGPAAPPRQDARRSRRAAAARRETVQLPSPNTGSTTQATSTAPSRP